MRLLAVELLKLRRAYTLPLTLLFAVGGPVVWALALRGVTTLAEQGLGGSTAVGDFLEGLITASDPLTPALFLLAAGVAAAYVFGREYSEGTIENLLTTPVRREAFLAAKLAVLALWLAVLAVAAASADVLTRVALGLAEVGRGVSPTVFGEYLVLAGLAFLGLPLVAWAAMRWRGYVGALTVVTAVAIAAAVASQLSAAAFVPLLAPAVVWHGGASGISIGLALALFGLGLLLCLAHLRYADQV
jgi:ABC-type transport system involved in multi-copper enzyme maturation permease subunit